MQTTVASRIEAQEAKSSGCSALPAELMEPAAQEHNIKVRQQRSVIGPTSRCHKAEQINYWHFKQTGIKSRPLKPLRHPIEHIELKIMLTYLLVFIFKLIAILTGPVIVLIVYVITVPFTLIRRSIWFLLNLSCLMDARIKTIDPSRSQQLYSQSDNQNKNSGFNKQIYWNYCPLSYLESYWFREKLINNILIEVDSTNADFSLDKLRSLIKRNVLSKPTFRKFLSGVVSRGLPLYESYYWHYLGLDDTDESNSDRSSILVSSDESSTNLNPPQSSGSSRSSAITCPFSASPSTSQADLQETHLAESTSKEGQTYRVSINDHIYLDQSLSSSGASYGEIRRHLYKLLGTGLDMDRPLWELRVLPASEPHKFYIIFRCHQSLADGQSLSNILTNCLTCMPIKSAQLVSDPHSRDLDEKPVNEDQSQLREIKEKKSFVGRVSATSSLRNSIFVAPLTILLWIIWTFTTRRKNNHLKKCPSESLLPQAQTPGESSIFQRRFYMTHYDLTKFYQIKQMTKSTASDVILCALSGALRDYLRKFNAVSNPPNLEASLLVDMRSPTAATSETKLVSSNRDNNVTKPSDLPLENLPLSSSSRATLMPQMNLTLVNVPLPTSVEGAVPRLWELRSTMSELRTSADPWVMLGLQQFLFKILPISWYQSVINYIALRNASLTVSNLRGPQNMVEAWCVDLFQQAVFESRQPANTLHPDSIPAHNGQEKRNKKHKRRQKKSERKFFNNLGSITSIYYCLQPPTSEIPISFNCLTYHNKLFVSALSRSLLVEDSKLLIRLFFQQLDQLANTVAKRKSLVAIVRMPAPIEISCEHDPSEGQLEMVQVETLDEEVSASEHGSNERQVVRLFAAHKDDIEANIGTSTQINRCESCRESICVCRRRKSLFSFDFTKQRTVGLISSMLHPSHPSANSRNDVVQHLNDLELSNAPDCLCGRQLFDELDTRLDNEPGDASRDLSSVRCWTPDEDHSRPQSSNVSRRFCAKCQATSASTTSSLDKISEHRASKRHAYDRKYSCMTLSNSLAPSQIIVPENDKLDGKPHASSETNLDENQRAGSWFVSWRTSRKSHKTIKSDHLSSRNYSSNKKFIGTHVEFIDKCVDSSKHWKSGTSNSQRSIVVKDEINADVSLRYQLDRPLIGFRTRRFSTVGVSVPGTERRASLTPFSLIQNQSLSKLFRDNNEANL